jgi:hypothetical protein
VQGRGTAARALRLEMLNSKKEAPERLFFCLQDQ